MTIRETYKALFDATATNIASEPFRLDTNPASLSPPALRMSGDLDGGTIVLQTLQPTKTIGGADNSYASADWQDTDDVFALPSFEPLERSRVYCRLKIKSIGVGGVVTVYLIAN